jgi:hypothetical protein
MTKLTAGRGRHDRSFKSESCERAEPPVAETAAPPVVTSIVVNRELLDLDH